MFVRAFGTIWINRWKATFICTSTLPTTYWLHMQQMSLSWRQWEIFEPALNYPTGRLCNMPKYFGTSCFVAALYSMRPNWRSSLLKHFPSRSNRLWAIIGSQNNRCHWMSLLEVPISLESFKPKLTEQCTATMESCTIDANPRVKHKECARRKVRVSSSESSTHSGDQTELVSMLNSHKPQYSIFQTLEGS